METFALASAVHGHNVYQDVWRPSIREKLIAKQLAIYLVSFDMFNIYSLKVFSSIYDPYKPFYSLGKQWSHV